MLQANQTYTDVYGKDRKAGEQWIITVDQTSSHLLDVYEELIKRVEITVLNEDEFCYVLNPLDENG